MSCLLASLGDLAFASSDTDPTDSAPPSRLLSPRRLTPHYVRRLSSIPGPSKPFPSSSTFPLARSHGRHRSPRLTTFIVTYSHGPHDPAHHAQPECCSQPPVSFSFVSRFPCFPLSPTTRTHRTHAHAHAHAHATTPCRRAIENRLLLFLVPARRHP